MQRKFNILKYKIKNFQIFYESASFFFSLKFCILNTFEYEKAFFCNKFVTNMMSDQKFRLLFEWRIQILGLKEEKHIPKSAKMVHIISSRWGSD
jgi:hypothetical protein